MPKVAIIGGTGVYESGILADVNASRLLTPYGQAVFEEGILRTTQGRPPLEVVFLARHGASHAIPPHRINYRANIWALHQLGVERIIGTGAVGSLREDFAPGDCVLADGFLDFTRTRPLTFFEGEPVAPGGPSGVVHTDMTEPYCPQLRRLLAEAAEAESIALHDGGCYVCTEGPRFESAAEIRAYRRLGADIVGMTNLPEVILARELGMCYALIAMVTNYAAGMTVNRLTHAEVVETMAENVRKIRAITWRALAQLPHSRTCDCAKTEQPME